MNYNTEVTLNPIYQNSDFEIVPINNDINLNLELTDFDIEVSIGGNPGEAATIEVGIVSTVDYSTPASVTNSGTPYNAVFDFGIPKGHSCYLYVAYASDDIGTDFTMTFNQSLDYIAILESNTEILNPMVTDFAGLWKNYKGEQGVGIDGKDGDNGKSAYEIAVSNGFVGTEVEWLASLQGETGSSTETGQYVLSGNDADITLGRKTSETVRQKHQITAPDIYLEVTDAPTDYDIVVDVQKNGVSIFTIKPKITAGTIVPAGTHTLAVSPTVFNIDDKRTITVDQVGTSTGKNLLLSLIITKI